MFHSKRIGSWLFVFLFAFPMLSIASIPVKSMVVFGDSLSDIGNTTHLLKSIRNDENPAYLVGPFKQFVLNKMIDFANDYYVPQMVLDAGLNVVNNFFDKEVGPYIGALIGQVRLVPILPGEPYWKSRFSNGRVWNEYLAQMVSIKKSDTKAYQNYAYAGSWASTYDNQLTVWNLIRHPLGTIKTLIVGKLIPPSFGFIVQGYLMEQREINDSTVYFIASGTTDYINVLLFDDKYNTEIMSNYVDNVLVNLSAGIKKLADSGARKFVILGIPHMGDLPKFVKTNDRDVLNDASDMHNERLAARIDELKSLYPTADFLFVSSEEFLAKAATAPEQYGFTNTTDACIDAAFPMYRANKQSPFAGNFALLYAQTLHSKANTDSVHICDAPNEYLFWDEIHPSTRAHNYFAYDVCLAMKEHGYEVSCKSPDLI